MLDPRIEAAADEIDLWLASDTTDPLWLGDDRDAAVARWQARQEAGQ